jgi:hypothetical protein
VLLITPLLVNAGCGGEEADGTQPPPDPVLEFVGMQALLLTTSMMTSALFHCPPPKKCCRFKAKAPARHGRCDMDAAYGCGKTGRTRLTPERFQHAHGAEGPYRLSGDLTIESDGATTEGRGKLSVFRGGELERSGAFDSKTVISPFKTCVRGVVFGEEVNWCLEI